MRPVAAAVLLAISAGCSNASSPTGPGALSATLIASASNESNSSHGHAPETVTSVIVSVTRVRAHVESLGWIDLSDAPVQVDLLALPVGGADLGLAHLPAGRVTQIRVLVAATGNYVGTSSGEKPLVVPSGTESGIKIPGPWRIAACNETIVSLEFGGKKSVWYHPTDGGSVWTLRPVIRLKRVRYAGSGCDGGEGACVPASCPSGLCGESGTCAPGGTGDGCTDGDGCLSGTCGASGCEPGASGDPCRDPADCASGSCGEDGACAPGDAAGEGAACTYPSDCLSKICNEGTCGPGAEGSDCTRDSDCQADLGLYCVELVCLPR